MACSYPSRDARASRGAVLCTVIDVSPGCRSCAHLDVCLPLQLGDLVCSCAESVRQVSDLSLCCFQLPLKLAHFRLQRCLTVSRLPNVNCKVAVAASVSGPGYSVLMQSVGNCPTVVTNRTSASFAAMT
jgi:hypothetical protein